ncbi:YesL family protein [Evansella tamaricis]|uniref:DUF624 domain-containing protein n=1 Tax=Evansella tamaricis TaxID=2069301 RepID=A0ABS6JE99_9BACI|nr:DUF624 domain-containing protein [Evansella tamaricis]MBU9711172.1 DUF624 domain-containing protein [Evansella tamaricis]
MQTSGFPGKVFQFFEWIMWIAYINILWLLFTVLGGVLFGAVPATIAMLTVYRKLFMKEMNSSIFHSFYTTFKKEFIIGNGFAGILLFAGLLFYSYVLFLSVAEGFLFYFFTTLVLLLAIISIITFLFLLPVYVHYELTFLRYFKQAFLIGILNPLLTFSMICILGMIIALYLSVPSMIVFLGVGMLGLVNMKFAMFSFERLEEKRAVAPTSG